MKFGIDKITLWSTNQLYHELNFSRNKVNVITGGSNTGKSSIIKIFDYCLMASEHKIPHSIINENVSWYGVKLYINDKTYFIARKSSVNNKGSKDYYFSTIGNIPSEPHKNISEAELKDILNKEFSIEDNITIPFGGEAIKANSRLSFRYLLMFNTISEDIITNSELYFDKQNEPRYREALPRIFDIAMGINNIENILSIEEKNKLEKRIKRLERRSEALNDKEEYFERDIQKIAHNAAKNGFIPPVDRTMSAKELLQSIEESCQNLDYDDYTETLSSYNRELFKITQEIRNLNSFTKRYDEYKDLSKNIKDSLIPIEKLIEKDHEVIKSSIFHGLINDLNYDLRSLKSSIKPNRPFERKVKLKIEELTEKKQNIETAISQLPNETEYFLELQSRWEFKGTAIGSLKVYAEINSRKQNNLHSKEIETLEATIAKLNIKDNTNSRDTTISLINEIALDLMKEASKALDNYANWKPTFDYSTKKLQLRKPLSTIIENVGSSSNHMFLHLIHFLSIHEAALTQKSKFIPSMLFIDQPSRPYWGDENTDITKENLDNSDQRKVGVAFNLISQFITNINMKHAEEFQVIMFEHVPARMFSTYGNVNVLEPFRNGEALIPLNWNN